QFLALTIINSSQMIWMLKPAVPGRIETAEEEAVANALIRQKRKGNDKATTETVRRKILFIHDKDGSVWKSLGLKANDSGFHYAVIGADGSIKHLVKEPESTEKILPILKSEF